MKLFLLWYVSNSCCCFLFLLIWEKTLLYKRKLGSSPVSTMGEFNQSINQKKIWAFVLLFFFLLMREENFIKENWIRDGGSINQSIQTNSCERSCCCFFLLMREKFIEENWIPPPSRPTMRVQSTNQSIQTKIFNWIAQNLEKRSPVWEKSFLLFKIQKIPPCQQRRVRDWQRNKNQDRRHSHMKRWRRCLICSIWILTDPSLHRSV